jgi:hypothetical protein
MMELGHWVVLIASLLASFALGVGGGGLSMVYLMLLKQKNELTLSQEELRSTLDALGAWLNSQQNKCK